MHRFTILVQDGLLTTAIVETMKMDLDSLGLKSREFIKHVVGPPIVGGVWYVK
jgi:hypothetical protein